MAASGDGAAGDAYSRLITQQLVEERAAKASLEHRAAGIVTASGGLTVGLFGILLFLLNPEHPGSAAVVAVAAVATICLVVSSIFAWETQRPLPQGEASVEALRRLATDKTFWTGPSDLGGRRVAEVEVDILDGARQVNGSKAYRLTWAIRFVVAGTLTIVAMVVVLLWSLTR